MGHSRNPFAFTPLPVTILSSVLYITIFAVLLFIHHSVPNPPKNGVTGQWPGVNITTAWQDLKTLSNKHHPFNSAANLEVRAWLAGRIEQIVRSNGVDPSWEIATPSGSSWKDGEDPAVTFLDDRLSNITFTSGTYASTGLNYYEGDNLIVYIRGTEDVPGPFWHNDTRSTTDLVLVSAHFDSVSTGFGTTDDGMGIISILQLIAHFTSPGRAPKHGIVALLNNEEEDGLYGAAVFSKHPIARHASTFLNLEGAGAGGRATLFRSTDVGVTRAYAAGKYPFGNVLSSDGFKRGLVRSGTDYSEFVDRLSMRGLDVAFMGPRSMYHSDWDNAKHSSQGSLWHMLSTALATTKALTEERWGVDERGDGVWFDLFGRLFIVLNLRTEFALDIVLLVIGPLVLIVLEVLLKKQQKWYPFTSKAYLHGADDDDPVVLNGLRSFFRFPIVFVVSSGIVVALCFLVTKINPLVLYSSPYVVWVMLITAFISVAWFLLSLANAVRPSALSRFYGLLWLYILSWIALLGAAVAAGEPLKVAGTYTVTLYNFTAFLALIVSYLDFFALPSKQQYAYHVAVGASRRPSHSVAHPSSRPTSSRTADDGEEATERTALLSPTSSRPTFANYRRHSGDPTVVSTQEEDEDSTLNFLSSKPYEEEQGWSATLPVWTWIPQALLLLPIPLILIGQIGLFLTYALHQTPADGNDVLTIYLFFALITIVLLLPLTPFLHRVVWQLPTLLFAICIGTTIYNLLGAPFTAEARLRVFFVQRVNLDSGVNEVAVLGPKGYVSEIVAELPSAVLNGTSCGRPDKEHQWAKRGDLHTCLWNGLAPDVMRGYDKKHPPRYEPYTTAVTKLMVGVEEAEKGAQIQSPPSYTDWLRVTASRLNSTSDNGSVTSLITLSALNTRSCRLILHNRDGLSFHDYVVLNACPDATSAWASSNNDSRTEVPSCPEGAPSNPVKPSHGDTRISLLSRTFDPTFRIIVKWSDAVKSDESVFGQKETPVEVEAVCNWADTNVQGRVPALEEALQYAPVWSTFVKHDDGLVEGFKRFAL